MSVLMTVNSGISAGNLALPSQICQVSRNFREPPEIVHDLHVARKCYKISRNLGNSSVFLQTKHAFDMNPRGF